MDVDEEQNIHALSPHLLRSMDSVMKSPTLPEAEVEAQTNGAAGAREDSNDANIPDRPPAFEFALQLVFQMLLSVLRRPTSNPQTIPVCLIDVKSVLDQHLNIPHYRSETLSYFGNSGAKHPVGRSSFHLYCRA